MKPIPGPPALRPFDCAEVPDSPYCIAALSDLTLEIEKALPAMNPESARSFETAVRAMLMLAKQGQSAVAADFDRLLQEEEALRATMRQQGRRFSANDRLSRDELHDRHALRGHQRAAICGEHVA